MKITKEHYAHMENAMKPIMEQYPFSQWQEAGLTGKRYRWDICRGAGLIPFLCDELYQYCDDSHIDTALRRITETD